MLPIDRDRIAPVLDAARHFYVISPGSDGTNISSETVFEDVDLVSSAKRIAGLGGNVLICGAVSWPLEVMLVSAGMKVIPNTCGQVDEVVAAYFSGRLTEQSFLMPGCRGRRHRGRHRQYGRWR